MVMYILIRTPNLSYNPSPADNTDNLAANINASNGEVTLTFDQDIELDASKFQTINLTSFVLY